MKKSTDKKSTDKKSKKSKIGPAKKTKRPIQLANPSQIVGADLDDVTPIVQFLEDFRNIVDPRAQHKSKLISIKIPEPLLAAFKFKATQEKTPYQTMIKKLMVEWLERVPRGDAERGHPPG
jgi:predicted DNA binding CopG/RHH family protein